METQHENQETAESLEASNIKPRRKWGWNNWNWKKFRPLDVIGVIGLVVLVINLLGLFFSLDVSVRRKPLLNKLLGATSLSNSVNSLNGDNNAKQNSANTTAGEANLEGTVIPSAGVVLPVVWGDLGVKMAAAGVIDAQQFEALYAERGGLDAEGKQLLTGAGNGRLKITPQNSGVLLNLLWAFGLGNKNEILDKGPMQDPAYGGAGGFASTGGWTLARGDAMSHYSKHDFVTLTAEQQKLVERVSQGIYRPCCGNSTYFPDCNHGMAMLGLLEIMASQGVSEQDMYRVSLAVNSYWFPDTYLTIAKYMETKGVFWGQVDAKEVLGVNFSSASGYRQVLNQVTPPERQGGGGGGCGV
ncbi:hypothetical protein A3I40_04285 [Candidatus Uhrbacteria bacterium RIFCSPLOWO2_02_FULL_48_12]|uniref:Uncharacterized protein n=1 Tax=Candidatus Uhrbacteria bacterium RIFCSPLOWO2_02_FULL_48_12 TaxID=1802407 RepID=A0A1F7VAM1_9BACT|nr:MAG: hypothetical protein A3I40_04285 [Candidatus Uhrbacteria bacterium RIFCSPLOWO2_02_FULL_48_12]